jgi:hypothetical protein
MPADWHSIRDAWRDQRPAPPPHRAWTAPLLPMPPTRRERANAAITWALLPIGVVLIVASVGAVAWLVRLAWVATRHVIQ